MAGFGVLRSSERPVSGLPLTVNDLGQISEVHERQLCDQKADIRLCAINGNYRPEGDALVWLGCANRRSVELSLSDSL